MLFQGSSTYLYNGNKLAVELVNILLEYKDKLSISINEPAGADNYAAIQHAVLKSSREVCEALVKHGVDTGLKVGEKTVAEHAETRFGNANIESACK